MAKLVYAPGLGLGGLSMGVRVPLAVGLLFCTNITVPNLWIKKMWGVPVPKTFELCLTQKEDRTQWRALVLRMKKTNTLYFSLRGIQGGFASMEQSKERAQSKNKSQKNCVVCYSTFVALAWMEASGENGWNGVRTKSKDPKNKERSEERSRRREPHSH